jgi:site-specific recombinase XerD
MSSDYDAITSLIEKADKENEKIICEFTSYLESLNLSKKTIKSHVSNIYFFAEFLNHYVHYEEQIQTLVIAKDTDISTFSLEFFPKKAVWASTASAKQNTSTFKKFYTWMYEQNKISKETYTDIINIIKEEKSEWHDAAVCDDDYIW